MTSPAMSRGLTVLTGGARSGKSVLAVRFGASIGGPVTFIASAPSDAGMDDRIARHRRDRPGEWTTIEEPVDLTDALNRVEANETVVVDCVTLWVSNLMLAQHDDGAIESAAERFTSTAAGRPAATIVVTNEVGSGVHPATELGFRFQDLLGRVNAIIVASCERAFLCVAGRAIALRSVDEVWVP